MEPHMDTAAEERNLRLQRDSALYLASLDAEARRAHTEPARRAFLQQLEQQADPDGVLTPDERAYRAKHLRRAALAEVSRLGVAARRRKAEERRAAEEREELDLLAEALANIAKAS